MSGVTVPTPFAVDGLLYIASGCAHSSQRPVYAIRPGATGDISLQSGATANAHVAWSQRRAAPYVTSPLVYDGQFYVLLDKGFLAAYDAITGEEVYGKQRFPGDRAAFTASPWAYDGKVFCLTETGETYVIEAGPNSASSASTTSTKPPWPRLPSPATASFSAPSPSSTASPTQQT